MRKLKLKEVKPLAQSHTAEEKWGPDFSPGLFAGVWGGAGGGCLRLLGVFLKCLRKDFSRSQGPPAHLLHTVPVGSGWSDVSYGQKAGRGRCELLRKFSLTGAFLCL